MDESARQHTRMEGEAAVRVSFTRSQEGRETHDACQTETLGFLFPLPLHSQCACSHAPPSHPPTLIPPPLIPPLSSPPSHPPPLTRPPLIRPPHPVRVTKPLLLHEVLHQQVRHLPSPHPPHSHHPESAWSVDPRRVCALWKGMNEDELTMNEVGTNRKPNWVVPPMGYPTIAYTNE
ncbi:unnamed protein product [Closterium sp. NIES-53]